MLHSGLLAALGGVCDLGISEMLTKVNIVDIYHFLLIYQTY